MNPNRKVGIFYLRFHSSFCFSMAVIQPGRRGQCRTPYWDMIAQIPEKQWTTVLPPCYNIPKQA